MRSALHMSAFDPKRTLASARGSEVLSAARVPLINAIVARLIYINGVSRGRSRFFTEAGCEVPAMKMSSVLP